MTTSFEAGRVAALSAADGLHLANDDILEGDDYDGAFQPKMRLLNQPS